MISSSSSSIEGVEYLGNSKNIVWLSDDDDNNTSSDEAVVKIPSEEDEGKYDDEDEETLTLRLMALRSMTLPEEDITKEMTQLLEEADDAASKAENTNLPDLSYLVQKLRKNLAAQKNEECEELYSPTQSPLSTMSPESMDMELVSENEAEILFFRQQEEEPLSWITQISESTTSKEESDDEETMRALLLSSLASKKRSKIPPSPKLPTKKVKLSSRVKSSTNPNRKKKSNSIHITHHPHNSPYPFETVKKHFPNMVKSFVIPKTNLSSSEEESSNTFESSLNQFISEARSKSSKKTTPPPKPIRKNPPKTLSKDKELEIHSNIKHLAPERQLEYKRLLAVIAYKEKSESIPNKPVEDLRESLLYKISALKNEIAQKEQNGKSRNVLCNVEEKEEKLIKMRNEVTTDLFKLSAQLSQFRNEKEKLGAVIEIREDLKSQLIKTEKVIEKRKERLVQLRQVVKASHDQISKKRKDLYCLENECLRLGKRARGKKYAVPKEGKDSISQKLSHIASNAQVQMTTTPLAHLKRHKTNIDPHTVLCKFDLQGKCNDDECHFQHH